MKKIILAGGSGYLGSVLAQYFNNVADEIVILSRNVRNANGKIREVLWDGETIGPWAQELEDADVLINLAGKSVNRRYTKANKEAIYSSRLNSTNVLGEAILKCNVPPRIWINSSSATIYRGSFDIDMTEATGETGDDFSMDVCKKWEAAFSRFLLPHTRKIITRTSIVLGRTGGGLPPLLNLAKIGLGGPQGDGKQYVSWIHERDFCRALEWLIRNKSAEGIYNVVSPGAITNAFFMSHLRQAARINFGIALSRTLLKIGAVLIRTETELVLKSRKVYPQRLLNEGFVFEFSDTKEALEHLCQPSERRS